MSRSWIIVQAWCVHICFILIRNICFILIRNVLKTNIQWSEKTESFTVLVIASILVLYLYITMYACKGSYRHQIWSGQVTNNYVAVNFMAHPPQVWVRVGLVGGLMQFQGWGIWPRVNLSIVQVQCCGSFPMPVHVWVWGPTLLLSISLCYSRFNNKMQIPTYRGW